MELLYVKINKETTTIDKRTFVDLLDLSPIKEQTSYLNALTGSEISFQKLKIIAEKADVPYPLFFAPRAIVQKQLIEKNRRIYSKFPTKDEIRLSSRGRVELQDIELIIKDLARKQEFLKSRVLPQAKANTFVGCVAKMDKERKSIAETANAIRNYLGLELKFLRKLSKDKVLDYIRSRAESQNVLVSFSSYNYMPQNINKETELSGICVKDKKFPIIFINTRDGDDDPKILETAGRQVFTLVSMLVCIALNKFLLSSKFDKAGDGILNKVFAIAGEILIPAEDLANTEVFTPDDLKKWAQFFKVTPSMLMSRLIELKKIDRNMHRNLKEKLSEELKRKTPKQMQAPLQTNAYAKYNGQRFSREVIQAFRSGRVSHEEVKTILFRRGKMNGGLFEDYAKIFS